MSLPRGPISPQPRSAIRLGYNGIPIGAVAGQRLLDAILDAGFEHRHICGGNGFCTSCRVEVVSDDAMLSPITELERARLGSDAGTLRLACQTIVLGPAAVRVPCPRSAGFGPDGD